MKIKAARFAGKLCTTLSNKAGGYMQLVIDALTVNL